MLQTLSRTLSHIRPQRGESDSTVTPPISELIKRKEGRQALLLLSLGIAGTVQ